MSARMAVQSFNAFQAYYADFGTNEVAKCFCGGVLSFDTDLNGYVIERCTSCKQSKPMTVAPRRSLIESQVVLPETVKCMGCGCPVGYSGSGPKRERCTDCTNLRQRQQSRDWNAKHRPAKRRRAA